jgi:hypothetical protein
VAGLSLILRCHKNQPLTDEIYEDRSARVITEATMLTGILLQHSLDWPVQCDSYVRQLDKICKPLQRAGGNYAEQSTDHPI